LEIIFHWKKATERGLDYDPELKYKMN